MTLAVDISNYTGPITAANVNDWSNAGVGLAIVQALDPPAGFPAGQTRQQLATLNAAGMPAEAYVFFWFDSDPAHVDRALALLQGLNVRRIWLDLEDVAAKNYNQQDTEAKVADALQRCDAWGAAQGIPQPRAGIYTGNWYWSNAAYMDNTETFKDRDLWDANYDFIGIASQGFRSYGGWRSCAIKQHIGSSAFGGVSGLDQDCLSDAYAQAVGGAPAAVPAPPAPVNCPPVPQDYRDKFGVGPDGWPSVAANLEGIIHQLMAEVEQVSLQVEADATKIGQLQALVATFNSGSVGQVKTPVGAGA